VGVELGGAGQESGRLRGRPGALPRQRAVCANDVLDMVSGQAPERVVALLAKLGKGRFLSQPMKVIKYFREGLSLGRLALTKEVKLSSVVWIGNVLDRVQLRAPEQGINAVSIHDFSNGWKQVSMEQRTNGVHKRAEACLQCCVSSLPMRA
jgi:hypothetical protein